MGPDIHNTYESGSSGCACKVGQVLEHSFCGMLHLTARMSSFKAGISFLPGLTHSSIVKCKMQAVMFHSAMSWNTHLLHWMVYALLQFAGQALRVIFEYDAASVIIMCYLFTCRCLSCRVF